MGPQSFAPNKIIVHQSASYDGPGGNTAAIRAYHKSLGWQDIGYHSLIELVGSEYEVIIGRPWTKPGAHTLGHNGTSFGLCFIGDFTAEAPPRAQLITGARHIAWILQALQIDPASIYPHSQFNETGCPGAAFPFELLLDYVRAAA